jgi:hypothetical protein
MKKIVLLIAAFCALQLNTFAQVSPITFGPMIGAGLAIPSSNINTSTIKPNGSFLAGAFVRVNIKRFYIQPEVYYINKVANFQYHFSDDSLNYDAERKVKTGNVNVNALLGVKLLKLTSLFNIRAFVGPTTSMIVARSAYNDGVKSNNPNLAKSSFNVMAGIGVDLGNLTIDARYEKGLTDISNGPENLTIDSVLLTLGFKILP